MWPIKRNTYRVLQFIPLRVTQQGFSRTSFISVCVWQVTVFDVASKSALRSLTGHKAAARVVRWRRDGLALFSGSDDRTVVR